MIIAKYFDGMYLGDGSLIVARTRKDGSPYWNYSLVIRDEQLELFDSLYHDVIHSYRRELRSTRYGFTYYQVIISDDRFCTDLDSRCGRSHSKHLESGLTDAEMWSVLSGLLDTDGNIDADKVSICNTDENIINGVKQYLDQLGITYTVFTQNTKNRPCYWVRIPATELKHTQFELLVPYKRDRYESLVRRSRGRRVELGKDWFKDNHNMLVTKFPKSTINRRVREGRFYLYEDELAQI